MEKRQAMGVSAVDTQGNKKNPPALGGIQLQADILVHRSPSACYQVWRDFENFPHFLSHVQNVSVVDDVRSHWVVSAPGDTTAEWDAEIIEDIPGERISWRSLAGSQIQNAGSVSFSTKGKNQTVVKLALTYNPPFGAFGEAISHLFGESPADELADDLTRFKETVEKEA